MRFRGRRITDSAKKRISQKAKDAEQKLKKAKSKESFWVVRKLKELWQKVTQPHVLKAAAASLISAAVSAAIVAIKSRMNAKKQLENAEIVHNNAVNGLKKEIKEKKEELEEATKSLREVHGNNERLTREARNRERDLIELKKEQNNIKAEIAKRESEISTLSRENESLRSSRDYFFEQHQQMGDRLDTENRNHQRQIREMMDEINQLRSDLVNNSQEGSALREELNKIEERITYAMQQEDHLNSHINYMRRHVRRLLEREEEAVQQVLQIHQRSIETQQEINAYDHTIRTLNPEAVRIRQEIMQAENEPTRAAVVEPRSAEFAEAGRYNGLTSESIGQNSGTAHNNAFSGVSNRFSSILSRQQGPARGNVNRQAFRNVQRNRTSANQLIERAREQNLPRGTNVFNERNNRYSSLELDDAYALWLNQFDF